MQKVIDALEEKYPGCRVIDIAFLLDAGFIGPIDTNSIEDKLAEAVRTAELVSIHEL